MSKPDDLETLMASESIKHANLQELARLVLAYDGVGDYPENPDEISNAYDAMVEFAKGVAQ